MLLPAIASIHRTGGRTLVREVERTFLLQAPSLLESARQHALAGSLPEVAQATHALGASSAMLGADRLQAASGAVERAALEGRSAALPDLLAQAGAELRDFEVRLKEACCRVTDVSVKPCILLVEDNADNRQLLVALLDHEYDIVECPSGREALQLLAQRTFSLVFMDIAMPEMDGIETLSRWRADPLLPRVPVIAVTAHAMTGDRERLLALGFDGYISKPIIEAGDLLAAATAALKGVR